MTSVEVQVAILLNGRTLRCPRPFGKKTLLSFKPSVVGGVVRCWVSRGHIVRKRSYGHIQVAVDVSIYETV